MDKIQPAKKSYFFGKGYKDLADTVKGAWKRNMDFVEDCKDKISACKTESLPKQIFVTMLNCIAIVSVLLFGSLITVLAGTVNALFLVLCMIPVYAGFTLVYLLDRAYLLKNKIFSVCPGCREKSMIPAYLCPKCGVAHSNLTPGVYGILHHTCTGQPGKKCGEKLPAAFFNGRSKLEAVCPRCGKSLCNGEKVPVCISVVGGKSSGKTAFITAFTKQFTEEIASKYGFTMQPQGQEDERKFGILRANYELGETDGIGLNKTENTFGFVMKTPGKKDRLVYLYDVDGRAFTENTEAEAQKQYLYAHGIVLVLDPYAFPGTKERLGKDLTPKELTEISPADALSVLDALLNKLREETGLREQELCRIPLAVVLTKADGPIGQEIGSVAIRAAAKDNGGKWTPDDLHRLCRDYLLRNGMAGFVNLAEIRFSDVRYFSVSAMGHAPGRKYQPYRVNLVMQWLFQQIDYDCFRNWQDYRF